MDRAFSPRFRANKNLGLRPISANLRIEWRFSPRYNSCPMKTVTVTDRNWEFLLGLLPADWKQLARTTGAITRLRGFAGEDQLLRALLMHVALGCSLRDTVVVAKAAGWLALSDVALLKKLRQSEGWLQALCVGVLRD